MPLQHDPQTILVIGSGPIVIGQAAEFDYAGTQACKALKEEGYRVVLVNSNPATIMTDNGVADIVYIDPLVPEIVEQVIARERPYGLLATLGGQTALNLAVQLAESGVLDRYGVRLLGTPLASIQQAEDRRLFKEMMGKIRQPVPESAIVTTPEDGIRFAEMIGFPVIVRPAYTLGGTGGGIAENREEFDEILIRGLRQSPIGQVLVERSIRGWKEIEYEVMRDSNDTCITVCNMENIDPVGVHTGDSIVVAPSQTLTDREYQMLRTAAIEIIRALKIEGGCNVQFALDPRSERYYVIEVNPRVSRSSALASKATGYPIAKIAAKIAVGKRLDEMINPVTGTTYASFEPALDYVVVKVPRWPFDKFPVADRRLGTQMKATGEVMALERRFEAALQKALRSLEIGVDGLFQKGMEHLSDEEVFGYFDRDPDDRRLFFIAEAFRRGLGVDEIAQKTAIDRFFLWKIESLVRMEQTLSRLGWDGVTADQLREAKILGFSDSRLAALFSVQEQDVRARRQQWDIRPAYAVVDTCAAEFQSETPYYYSTYRGSDEVIPSDRPKALVIGSGPIRIGQGIEFDYCSVHAVWALQNEGYETLIVNNNPETVSTDFDTADRLYFEPLTVEDVLNIIDREQVGRVFVQFGGQTAINLASKLQDCGVPVCGTRVEAIHWAEDREQFRQFLERLSIPQAPGGTAFDIQGALAIAKEAGYPVVVRPSYVIGGRAMAVVYHEEELRAYVRHATEASPEHPVLVDKYLPGKELEVDAVCDGTDILIPGIFEHIERAGVHSGDSMAVYPPQTLTDEEIRTIVAYTESIGRALPVRGLLNVQFVLHEGRVHVIEVNPRASRTVPIISKVTGIPLVNLAIKVQLGRALRDLGYGTGLVPPRKEVVVKAPVFSFAKIGELDIHLSPEMKSTGEVLGVGETYREALFKAFVGAGIALTARNGILCSIAERDKAAALPLLERLAQMGYRLYATPSTAKLLQACGVVPVREVPRQREAIEQLLRSGEIGLVLNIPTQGQDRNRLGFMIRRFAVEMRIPCLTSLDTAYAWLQAMAEPAPAEAKVLIS